MENGFEINGERVIERVQREQMWLTQVSVGVKPGVSEYEYVASDPARMCVLAQQSQSWRHRSS